MGQRTVGEQAQWQGGSRALLQHELASQLRDRGIVREERSKAALEAILRRWIRALEKMDSLSRRQCLRPPKSSSDADANPDQSGMHFDP
jgi:hypothetical protein